MSRPSIMHGLLAVMPQFMQASRPASLLDALAQVTALSFAIACTRRVALCATLATARQGSTPSIPLNLSSTWLSPPVTFCSANSRADYVPGDFFFEHRIPTRIVVLSWTPSDCLKTPIKLTFI